MRDLFKAASARPTAVLLEAMRRPLAVDRPEQGVHMPWMRPNGPRPGEQDPAAEALHAFVRDRASERQAARRAEPELARRKSTSLWRRVEGDQGASPRARSGVLALWQDPGGERSSARRPPPRPVPVLRRQLDGEPRCSLPLLPHAGRRPRAATRRKLRTFGRSGYAIAESARPTPAEGRAADAPKRRAAASSFRAAT